MADSLPPMKTKSSNHFATVVRAKLLDNKLEGRKPDSIRGLARALGNGDAVRGETFKRSLFKWMADGEPNPSRESRAIVARALGLDPSELSEDDEEADPMARFSHALDELVRRAVDEHDRRDLRQVERELYPSLQQMAAERSKATPRRKAEPAEDVFPDVLPDRLLTEGA